MTALVPLVLALMAVAFTLLGAYSLASDLWLRDRSRLNERVEEEFRKQQRERARKSPLFKDLGRVVAEVAAEQPTPDLRQRCTLLLEQAGLAWPLERVLAVQAGLGLGLGLVAGLLRGSLVLGLLAGLVGLVLPLLFISRRRQARLDRLLTQLPDAFDTLARALRAGQSLSQALQAVATAARAPLGVEFAYCCEQQHLGLAPDLAFQDLAQRCGLLELKLFALAALVQQQTGGNLAELLENLSTLVRERLRLRRKLRTATAENRLQATVLVALPPVLFGIMLLVRREYAQSLFAYPELLAGTLLCQGLGMVWIHHVTRIDP